MPLRRLAVGLLLGAALGWAVGLLRAPQPRLPGEPW